MRPAVTGANGFIGGHLCRKFLEGGFAPIVLSRSPPTDPHLAACLYIPYSIERGLARPLPTDCDTVVHCAYRMGPAGEADHDANVAGTLALRQAANEPHPRKFVFISSMSAHAGARSHYGRSKWKIEQLVDPRRDLVVKPGLVIGVAGLFQRIRQSLHTLPFVPLFYGGQRPVQTIWVGDLISGIEQALARNLTGLLALGSVDPVTLEHLYRTVLAVDKITKPLISIPGGVSWRILKITEALGLGLPLTSENLLGLAALKSFDTAPSLAAVGLKLQGLVATLELTRTSVGARQP